MKKTTIYFIIICTLSCKHINNYKKIADKEGVTWVELESPNQTATYCYGFTFYNSGKCFPIIYHYDTFEETPIIAKCFDCGKLRRLKDALLDWQIISDTLYIQKYNAQKMIRLDNDTMILLSKSGIRMYKKIE